jgi:hypothetical protein
MLVVGAACALRPTADLMLVNLLRPIAEPWSMHGE